MNLSANSLLALESAHAVWGAAQIAKTLPKDADVVLVRRNFCFTRTFLIAFKVLVRARRQGC